VPAAALSRVGARVVESGPGGENLAPGTWQRLEALPDPRSPQGRIYPLACLIAIAVCAFTAAGNDRVTAVGPWIKRADQADLARLRAPWDPVAGRYRAPDEKTIRVVLDRLDPRALTRALPGPRAHGRQRPGAPPSASVCDYHARRAAQQAKALARDRLRAVAVDGKTSRGARRADGTRVHLLGAAEHGGHLLDHAFTLNSRARHSLLPPLQAGPLTTPQASRHATDRIVAPPKGALDAGLRPGPFPDQAASLLPGLLAATRTGLPPAGDDELTNTKIHHGTTSRCHLRSAGRTNDQG
jgi:hypothetical protein